MKITFTISALLALLLTACATNEQTASTTANSSAIQSSKRTFYHGTIISMDMSANTVAIKEDDGTSMTLTVITDTKFRGGSKTLSDFKVGDTVSGSFMMNDSGKMVALSMKPYSSKG